VSIDSYPEYITEGLLDHLISEGSPHENNET
jgi:hypothetical protein